MSRQWASVAAVAVVLGVAGCGGDDGDGSRVASTGEQNGAPVEHAKTTTATAPTPSARPRTDSSKPDKSAGAADDAGPSGGGGSKPAAPREQQAKGPLAWGKKIGDGSIQRYGQPAAADEANAAWAAAQAYIAHRAADEWDQACARLTKSVAAEFAQLAKNAPELKGKSCGELLATFTAAGPKEPRQREARNMRLVEFRVDGDHGFVLFESAGLRHGFLPVAREGGEWKAGAAAPLGLDYL